MRCKHREAGVGNTFPLRTSQGHHRGQGDPPGPLPIPPPLCLILPCPHWPQCSSADMLSSVPAHTCCSLRKLVSGHSLDSFSHLNVFPRSMLRPSPHEPAPPHTQPLLATSPRLNFLCGTPHQKHTYFQLYCLSPTSFQAP